MRANAAQSPTIERVLQLQRTAGNAAVGRLLSRAEISGVEVPAAVNHVHGTVLQDDHALRHLRHQGTAFVRGAGEDASGVDANDIVQGFIGDCFFLSPLMATARINPGKIAKLVRGPIGESSGNSVYEVKLYNDSGDLVTHHVDDRFISNADGTPRYAQYGDRSAVGPELAQRRHREHRPDHLQHLAGGRGREARGLQHARDHHQPRARVGHRGGHLARRRALLQRRGREQDRPDDRRPEPARPQPSARLAVGDFRMIFEWYGILDASVK